MLNFVWLIKVQFLLTQFCFLFYRDPFPPYFFLSLWPLFKNCVVSRSFSGTFPASLQRSARERWGLLKQYTKSRYLRESALQETQPLFPPLCSPLSNCCSGPSSWKKRITSTTDTPLLVCRNVEQDFGKGRSVCLQMCCQQLSRISIQHECCCYCGW